MHKSLIIVVILFVIISLLLGGCGGAAEPTTAAPTTTVPTSSPPPTIPSATQTPSPSPTLTPTLSSNNGTIKGILIDEQTGEPITGIPVTLAVLPTEKDLLIRLYEDKRWESFVGSYGEQLWTQISGYVNNSDYDENLDVLYVIPFTPTGEKGKVQEKFFGKTAQTGAFNFTDVPPGIYYLLAGKPTYHHIQYANSYFPAYKYPAGATGFIGTACYIYIQGIITTYIIEGNVEGGLLEVKSSQTLDVGSITIRLSEETN